MSTREIRVLLFAGAREAVGSGEVAVWTEPDSTAGMLRALLIEEYPDAAAILGAARIAVNHEFVPLDSSIPDQAEVALVPPVSGG